MHKISRLNPDTWILATPFLGFRSAAAAPLPAFFIDGNYSPSFFIDGSFKDFPSLGGRQASRVTAMGLGRVET